MKKIIIGVIIIIAVFIGSKYVYEFIDLMKYRQTISEIVVSDIDISKIPDGTYKGNFEAVWVGADVEVAVKNHKITDISLIRHKNDRGKAAEIILQKVIEAQSLKVDTVAGATSSSKVILEAIEIALKSANK